MAVDLKINTARRYPNPFADGISAKNSISGWLINDNTCVGDTVPEGTWIPCGLPVANQDRPLRSLSVGTDLSGVCHKGDDSYRDKT